MKTTHTYGETVGAEAYTSELQFHQYIPQADAAILDEIKRYQSRAAHPISVLDLGMGPGRLTRSIAELPGVTVVGLDNSPDFVAAATTRNVPAICTYICANFLEHTPVQHYDVILMQGVWHHVPLSDRSRWLTHISEILNDDGVLIVGDEYIPQYSSEAERAACVGLFYAHIIGEAVQIQNNGLARNESLNFLADTLHESEHCGYYDESLLSFITAESIRINKMLYSFDPALHVGEEGMRTEMKRLLQLVRTWSHDLSVRVDAAWIDRGDYKISVHEQLAEFRSNFVLLNRRDSGPVEHIGGMSVLTFAKPHGTTTRKDFPQGIIDEIYKSR